MSLRARLVAYLIALHLVFFALSVALFLGSPPIFVGVELCLVVSFCGGVWLVGRALEPLAYTRRFHDLLQDQEYGARLDPSDAPELNRLIGQFNAMLNALHAERLKLGEQQGFLDKLLEATPSAVIVFDFDNRVSLANASAAVLLDLHAARGQALADLPDPSGLLSQLDALPLGEGRLFSDAAGRRFRCQRGQFFDRGFARHFLLVEELTAELESSERATYEKLIRVLAHEVNNTVAATGSVLDSLLFYSTQLAAPDQGDYTTAIEAVKRRNASLGEFIERFTRVVKMPAPDLRPTALADVVDDIVLLFREQCRARGIAIDLQRRAAPEVRMDRQLMEQALVNIVKNAMEAAEQGGHIRIELDDGGLSIYDSGNRLGDVPPHQLFAPFFTTKKGGQGIGLLFVREVLTRHGFPYRLAATGSGETRFEIRFA